MPWNQGEDWLKGPGSSFKSSCQIQPCGFKATAPNPQAPWTTARCNRLIRPLASKIVGLRRIKQLGSRELKISQPDSVGIIVTGDTRAHKFVHSRQGNEESRNDAAESSPTDSDRDPWSDVLGEERARKRLKRTYLARGNTQASTQTTNPSNSQTAKSYDQTPQATCGESQEDALALNRYGLPDPLLLDQQGKLVNLLVNANIDKINPDSILPGDFRSCSRHIFRAFRELAKSLLPVNWKLVEGIYENLDALLRATSTDPASKQGPRSLFATCLKQIPDYVTKEQLRITEEDPDDDSDMATIVYDELEALGTSSKDGWRPLKDVVRAHGIRLLAGAIEESLISLPIARGLVILCLHREACDEAQVIIESMLHMMKPLSKPNTTSNKIFAFGQSIALHTMGLLHGANGSDNLAFTYQQLAAMFNRGVLPIEWIACRDLVGLWNRVVISVTQGADDAPQAASLLRVVVSLMYGEAREVDEETELLRIRGTKPAKHGRHNDTTQSTSSSQGTAKSSTKDAPSDSFEASELRTRAAKTITNILTVLSSIAILQKPKWTILQDIGIEAQKAQEFAVRTLAQVSILKLDRNQSGLSLLALNLVEAHGCQNLRDFSEGVSIRLDAQYPTNGEFCAIAGSFVCNVSRCCGKAMAQDPFIYLRNLLEGLGRISQSQSGASQKVYEGISLTAAFEFAEETSQTKHLQWALELERKATGGFTGQTLRTPGKTLSNGHRSNRSGYRWEEGICEWVAKTPAGTLKGLKQDDLKDVDAGNSANNDHISAHTSLSQEPDGPPDMSPCLKKRKRGSKGLQEASGDDCRAPTMVGTREQSTDDESLVEGATRWNHASSDIEDLYNEEADELAVSPRPSSSKSSQKVDFTLLRPEPTGSTNAYQRPKYFDGSPQPKRVGPAGQSTLIAGVRNVTNGLVQAKSKGEESEDELSL